MAKQVKIEISGCYVQVLIHPIARGRPDQLERVAASRCTSDLRQKMNDRTSAQKFRNLIAANFLPGDVVVALTYSDDALPATPELARDRYLKPFLRRLRSKLKPQGEKFDYMYVTEGLHGDHRLHHHIILHAAPGLEKLVRNMWLRNGQNVSFETIASRGYDVWARYLTKEPRKTGRRYPGSRMWTSSIGLKKPIVITYTVEDDSYQYEPPAGVVIEYNHPITTEWFTCQYVSYRIPPYLMGKIEHRPF